MESVISNFFLVCLVLCCCGAVDVGVARAYHAKRGGSHDQWLQNSTQEALNQLQLKTPSENADKLAVVILLTDLQRKERDRIGLLRLSIDQSSKNLYPFTPCVVYIFTLESEVDEIKSGLGDKLLPNMVVLPLHAEGWVAPTHAGSKQHWHAHHSTDYRLMGDWRLSYMPDFVWRMGHRYVMQNDDDSFIISPVGEDLVAKFDREKLLLGAKEVHQDPPLVTWGLPELARYFVMTHKVVPATLFHHCSPPNITGLYSAFKSKKLMGEVVDEEIEALGRMRLPTSGGWDRAVLRGNCVMYSLDWWFQPMVNRFVQLCRLTGGAFAYRWNEQGVIAMLWQIFVPPEQLHMFQFQYFHRGGLEEVQAKLKQLAEQGELPSSPPAPPPAEG